MDGGLITEVYSDDKLDIIVLDGDIEGSEPEENVIVDEEEFWWRLTNSTVFPSYIDKVLRLIEEKIEELEEDAEKAEKEG